MTFWPNPSENFLEEFLDGGPELVDTATACGKTYKCRIMGGRSMWQSTDSPDFDASLPDVEGCRVDSLAAASKAMGTCKPLPNAPDLCRSSAYPVLRSNDDDSPFVHFSSDVTRTKGMPLVIDATLQCVSEDVRKSTHVRTSTMEVGKLQKHEFEKRVTSPSSSSPPPLLPRASSTLATELSSSTDTPPGASHPPITNNVQALLLSTPSEDTMTSVVSTPDSNQDDMTTSSTLTENRILSSSLPQPPSRPSRPSPPPQPSQPRQPPPPTMAATTTIADGMMSSSLPPPSSRPTPPPPTMATTTTTADGMMSSSSSSLLPPPLSLQKCTWANGTRPTHVSCNVDSDCPQIDDDLHIFESWFDKRGDIAGNAGESIGSFVNAINNKLKDAEVTLPSTTSTNLYNKVSSTFSSLAGKGKDVMTRPNLHKKLLELYNSDDAFKTSIKAAVQGEEEFRGSRSNKCDLQTKRCTVPLSERPSAKLYDGKQKVTFVLNKNRVMTFQTEDGEDLPVYASRCGDGPNSSPLCTKEDGMYDVVLQKKQNKQKWEGHLDPSTASSSLVQGFRISVQGSIGEEYVVENAIQVPATEDAPQVCAQTLCTKHASQCPAPHCMRDESYDCVPAPTF